jgi:hypothetical protein
MPSALETSDQALDQQWQAGRPEILPIPEALPPSRRPLWRRVMQRLVACVPGVRRQPRQLQHISIISQQPHLRPIDIVARDFPQSYLLIYGG